MTQHQDLQLLRALRTPEKQQQREQAPNREVDKRPDHAHPPTRRRAEASHRERSKPSSTW
jgi:hypothetical protein